MFAKTIHPLLSMRKAFSLYTYNPIHEKLFPYTHVLLKTLSLYINTVYVTTLFLFKDFFVFLTYTRGLYKNFFIYTFCSHTRISFHTLFTHAQKLSIHFLYMKNSFLFFIYRHDICSQRLFLFFYSWRYHDFCSFYF